MCLVIAMVCFVMGYFAFQDANTLTMWTNIGMGLFFTALMIRNIVKTKQERNNK